MAQLHKEFDFLSRGEALSDFSPDLVYRPAPGSTWSDGVLFVDYELPRLRKFGARRVHCAELSDATGTFKHIVIYVTQFDAISQVRRDIYAAAGIIPFSGQLRVVVSPKGRPRKTAGMIEEVFSDVRVASSAGTTLFTCRKPVRKEPPDESIRLEYVEAAADRQLTFYAFPGMFSCNRIDEGTSFLLTMLPELQGRRLLDVGCGYGIIGISAAARGASVCMIDADSRAVKLTRRNLEVNSLASEVILDDKVPQESDTFDFVFSNPPTHAGSPVLRSLFGNMVRVCRRTGYVVIVVREQLNYEKWLTEMGSVVRLGTFGGYKILRIQKA
jgi:16S rRNA (guanine1207-N2)-methyltransferase